MKNRTDELREAIAGRIVVDCGYDSEYPCPHAHPTMGYEKCPHEDKDICMWQLEQADEFLKICKEKGLKFVPDYFLDLPFMTYPDIHNTINSQIEEIDIED